jgi:hypothetical protein
LATEQRLQDELHVDQAVEDIVRLIQQDNRTPLLIVQLLRKYQLDQQSTALDGTMTPSVETTEALPPQITTTQTPCRNLPAPTSQQPAPPAPAQNAVVSSTMISPTPITNGAEDGGSKERRRRPIVRLSDLKAAHRRTAGGASKKTHHDPLVRKKKSATSKSLGNLPAGSNGKRKMAEQEIVANAAKAIHHGRQRYVR